METWQREFVDLLVRYEVLRFGEFTLKSGRSSPYFVNAGQLRTGLAIEALGRAFATRIDEAGLSTDLIFGPSYKGVPLAVATAIAMGERDVGYAFDRKEAKDHGEGGVFVGTAPTQSSRVVVVDDVITSGRSIREAASLLADSGATIAGVVVAVDRAERGVSEDKTTRQELAQELSAPVLPIVDIRDVVEDLHERGRLPTERRDAVLAHVAEHGPRR